MASSAADAVILVGGQGTRLRPLTLSAPKPMLPTAGVPFLEHLLSRIRQAGITHVVLGTSYRAETFSEYFGDGSAFGLELDYVVEHQPLGTGGAIRNVFAQLRAETTIVFNGDVLSGVDLGGLLTAHHRHQADVTLHLVKVADPRAFGSVPTGPDGRVQAFVEKSDDPPTDQINAGCYVFRRDVIGAIPADAVISVERETFPGLLAAGAAVYGYVDDSYWLDLGTPAAFVRGSADLVTGRAPSAALPGPVGPALVLPEAQVDPTAVLTEGSTIGRGARVARQAHIAASVVFDDANIGANTRICRSIIGRGAVIEPGAVVCDAVIGDGATVGSGCELAAGLRLWPAAVLAPGSVRFSADS